MENTFAIGVSYIDGDGAYFKTKNRVTLNEDNDGIPEGGSIGQALASLQNYNPDAFSTILCEAIETLCQRADTPIHAICEAVFSAYNTWDAANEFEEAVSITIDVSKLTEEPEMHVWKLRSIARRCPSIVLLNDTEKKK